MEDKEKFAFIKSILNYIKNNPGLSLAICGFALSYYTNEQAKKSASEKYEEVVKMKDKQIEGLIKEKEEYKNIALRLEREVQINKLLNNK